MSELETKEIKLREVEPEDLDVLYKWENDTNIWLHSNTLNPFSKFKIKAYIESTLLDIYQTKQQRFMIDLKQEKKTIGTIDIFDIDFHNKRAGVGILIYYKKYRNKGYASQSLKLVINYTKKILGLRQLYCNILTENESSINLFKQNGFEITGEKKQWIFDNGKWQNQFFLQKIL